MPADFRGHPSAHDRRGAVHSLPTGLGRSYRVQARSLQAIRCPLSLLNRKEQRMDIDDLEPRKQPSKLKDLTVYSIVDLQAYVELLKSEILRAEAVIKQKDAHKDAASAFFKK
jgi:uncharacterized small protein (DUF1192 family)